MSSFELSFASGQDSLSVRHFTVNEALSSLFEVSVVAVSPLDDLDFETIVGHKASFTLHPNAVGHARGWEGVCCHFEQLHAEETGLSTYLIRIVPEMWLLKQRHDSRIFQHISVPAIVREVLSHWKIHPVMQIDEAHHPALEYRVQYGESDFAFISRLLEEAGITYRFSWNPEKGTELVLSDAPHRREMKATGLVPYADQPSPEARSPFVTRVSVARELRPGAFTIRDYDFKRRTGVELAGKAHHPAKGVEARLEQYHYQPGSFVVEGAGQHGHGHAQGHEHAHGHGHAHADQKAGAALAERSLEAERSLAEVISFQTNLLDIAAGTVFAIGGHPRARIAAPHHLLAVEMALEGGEGSELSISGRAVPAAHHFRPAKLTPRPRILGVQSAIVAGPGEEEIHTDEHGRVRVEFHWDRSGRRDERSSCWLRVNQGWAGSGFGMMVIPRVGQEVLVGFFEGDPDQPIVVGRVYNAQNRAPYNLPEHRTRSAWRSASTPNGGESAYNEIMFEDKKGAELFSIHAQRDLHQTVKGNTVERTGADKTITVGKSRTATVGGADSTIAGARHSVSIASPAGAGSTGIEMSDRRIVCTTGDASITFDGENLSLEAKGNVTILSHDGDVVIKGGPNVKINCD